MNLTNAQLLGSIWVEKLKPFCDRIEIAGSIRRKKPEVKDIEIVCIPKEFDLPDLFNRKSTMRDVEFVYALRGEDGKVIRLSGDPERGKYIKLHLQEHNINVDVFIATPDNWGYIYAIRTGSADFSHRVLAAHWKRAGYHGEDGMLRDDHGPVPVREEADLFKLIGLDWVEPEYRTWPFTPRAQEAPMMGASY